MDPLSIFFEDSLDSHNLIDIPSAKIQPTWRNNRTEAPSLARRLDRFLIREALVNRGYQVRQWIGSGGVFDHRSIYLELTAAHNKPKAPFKFNSTWLKDAGYMKAVSDYWKAHTVGSEGLIAEGFARNMCELKKISIEWARRKKGAGRAITQIN